MENLDNNDKGLCFYGIGKIDPDIVGAIIYQNQIARHTNEKNLEIKIVSHTRQIFNLQYFKSRIF